MKIVVTGTRGIPNILGGVETHCQELFPLIATYGYDVTVVRRKIHVHDNLTEYRGVHLVDISTFPQKSFEAIIHTLKAVWAARFPLHADILHIHAIGPSLLVPFARLLGLKVVFTHHGFDYHREKWDKLARIILKFGEWMGCRFANEVIVISKVINDFIKQAYSRVDAHLIYNGVPEPVFIDNTLYLEQLGIKKNQYILAMGRFVPEKKFHQLIDVFAEYFSSEYQMVLAGDAVHEDEYTQELKRKAKENNVILTGFVKGEKLHELFTHAKIFVLPSSHEGLPISLLEAMSYHLPVLASDIAANLEIGLPSANYFSVGDKQDLRKKLSAILASETSRVAYPMEKYNWQHIAAQTIAVYQRCLAGNDAGKPT
jgi:glycosyltransferase involved in cell wall biosynthesis